jgi:hypothetical protein
MNDLLDLLEDEPAEPESPGFPPLMGVALQRRLQELALERREDGEDDEL